MVDRMRQIQAANDKDASATRADIIGIPKQEFAILVTLVDAGFAALFRGGSFMTPRAFEPRDCEKCYICGTWTATEQSHRCPVIEL